MRTKLTLILSVVAAVLVVIVFAMGFHWTVNRVYVPEGYSLQLRYKGPLVFGGAKYAQPGRFAAKDEDGDLEIGIVREMPGPGRHFYCPIWWETKLVQDTLIEPGAVGVVVSKLGDDLPKGEFLVSGDLYTTQHKGILRKVLAPGRYRVNPYAYEVNVVQTLAEAKGGTQVKHAGWVRVPAGYVGVVTYKAADPDRDIRAGVHNEVLPPGLYPVNPYEQEVDIIGVGFVEKEIKVEVQQNAEGVAAKDKSNEPVAVSNTGISFSSTDGFNIQLDFTAIWGVMPEQAAEVIATFGNLEAVEQKVIVPQAESICRNIGSKMKAVDLLVGATREAFQTELDTELQRVLDEKNLTLQDGLVRHVYIPNEVRLPIQEGYVADEMKLTREQESTTAKTEADLREAEKMVEKEAAKIKEETKKLVAEVIAEGAKQAKETEAETEQLVAAIDKQVADLDAQRKEIIGQAEAKAQQLQEEAKAQKFQLAVEAFGSGEAYNLWQFAEGLPQQMDLQLFYAGEGTLWTDLKNIVPTIPLKTAPPAEKAKR
jgi:regulator of protease activity HflC (stomatin/prohibitin superfamily)